MVAPGGALAVLLLGGVPRTAVLIAVIGRVVDAIALRVTPDVAASAIVLVLAVGFAGVLVLLGQGALGQLVVEVRQSLGVQIPRQHHHGALTVLGELLD